MYHWFAGEAMYSINIAAVDCKIATRVTSRLLRVIPNPKSFGLHPDYRTYCAIELNTNHVSTLLQLRAQYIHEHFIQQLLPLEIFSSRKPVRVRFIDNYLVLWHSYIQASGAWNKDCNIHSHPLRLRHQ